MCKRRYSSLDLSSAPISWISAACAARHIYTETATASAGITQACAIGTLWGMSDLLSSDWPVLASELPSKSYLALPEDDKVCSAHYEHFI